MTLRPGDILYLPRGIVHSTIAHAVLESANELEKQHSIHYTIGVETETLAYTREHILNCAAGLVKSSGLLSSIRTRVQAERDGNDGRDEKRIKDEVSLGLALRGSLDIGFLGLKYLTDEEILGLDAFEIHMEKKVQI